MCIVVDVAQSGSEVSNTIQMEPNLDVYCCRGQQYNTDGPIGMCIVVEVCNTIQMDPNLDVYCCRGQQYNTDGAQIRDVYCCRWSPICNTIKM